MIHDTYSWKYTCCVWYGTNLLKLEKNFINVWMQNRETSEYNNYLLFNILKRFWYPYQNYTVSWPHFSPKLCKVQYNFPLKISRRSFKKQFSKLWRKAFSLETPNESLRGMHTFQLETNFLKLKFHRAES